MSLAQGTFDTDMLRAFVGGFGEGVNDLHCEIKNLQLIGAVDISTHFCRKSCPLAMVNDSTYHAGVILIPDVHKVVAFLKASKEPTTTIRHVGSQLTVKNGNNEYSTPTYSDIISNSTVSRATIAIKSATENQWSTLGRANLQCHGTSTMESFKGLGGMSKVVGKDAPVRITVDDGQLTITAGTKRGSRMSRQADIDTDFKGFCEATFGSHASKLFSVVPSGDCIIHMGDKSAFVIESETTPTLLILKHQEGVDQ